MTSFEKSLIVMNRRMGFKYRFFCDAFPAVIDINNDASSSSSSSSSSSVPFSLSTVNVSVPFIEAIDDFFWDEYNLGRVQSGTWDDPAIIPALGEFCRPIRKETPTKRTERGERGQRQ